MVLVPGEVEPEVAAQSTVGGATAMAVNTPTKAAQVDPTTT